MLATHNIYAVGSKGSQRVIERKIQDNADASQLPMGCITMILS